LATGTVGATSLAGATATGMVLAGVTILAGAVATTLAAGAVYAVYATNGADW